MSWSTSSTVDAVRRRRARIARPSTSLSVGVEPGRRLVEQHDSGSRGQRPGHAHQLALALATGRRAWCRAGRSIPSTSSGPVECVARGTAAGGATRSASGAHQRAALGGDQQVLLDRQVVEQLQRLERAAETRAGPALRRQAADVLARANRIDARARHEPGDRVDARRLARAVRADQADQLARADVEIDLVDGHEPAEADRQPRRLEQRRHPPASIAATAPGCWPLSSGRSVVALAVEPSARRVRGAAPASRHALVVDRPGHARRVDDRDRDQAEAARQLLPRLDVHDLLEQHGGDAAEDRDAGDDGTAHLKRCRRGRRRRAG